MRPDGTVFHMCIAQTNKFKCRSNLSDRVHVHTASISVADAWANRAGHAHLYCHFVRFGTADMPVHIAWLALTTARCVVLAVRRWWWPR